MNPYESLANEIILFSVNEYKTVAKRIIRKRKELERVKKNPIPRDSERLRYDSAYKRRYYRHCPNSIKNQIKKDKMIIQEIQNFFLSDWFGKLTTIDGQLLIDSIEKELNNKRKR